MSTPKSLRTCWTSAASRASRTIRWVSGAILVRLCFPLVFLMLPAHACSRRLAGVDAPAPALAEHAPGREAGEDPEPLGADAIDQDGGRNRVHGLQRQRPDLAVIGH